MQLVDASWRSVFQFIGTDKPIRAILLPVTGASFCEQCGIPIPDTGYSPNCCAECGEYRLPLWVERLPDGSTKLHSHEGFEIMRRTEIEFDKVNFCRVCGSFLSDENFSTFYECHGPGPMEPLCSGYICPGCAHEEVW